VLDRITPLILTFNEAPNIGRVLDRLAWANRIVIVDSYSDDETEAIARRYPNVDVVKRLFDTHANQWNFGLGETGIDTDWVLALDADYVPTPEFVDQLRGLVPKPDVDGYCARFRYCIDGVPLRGGLYPPVTVLFRRAGARYVQDGHTQRIELSRRIEMFAQPLLHDDRKPLSRWFSAQIGYMRQEAAHLLESPVESLRLPDRVRRLVVVAPVLVFFYCLFVKGNALDGRRGVFYAMQRTVAEVMLSAFLVEAGILRREKGL
jgi:glycosyltransferase involved in cell wall biosynthesis